MLKDSAPWFLIWAAAAGAAATPATAVAKPPQPAQAPAETGQAVMLAREWQDSLDPAKYLISEKLDGVRALWDGRQLRFKSGRLIAAPSWFTAGLPQFALDGELWMGRGLFDKLSGIVRRATPVDAEWRDVRYMVFDLPTDGDTFAERARRLQSLLDAGNGTPAWLRPVRQFRLGDHRALQAQLASVVASGGEGLVLHRADALWQAGRSDALRKLKAQPDEEARVLAVIPGKGRLEGRMGALLVQTADGKQFSLGTGFSDAQREQPPAVGTLVTYRYRDKTPAGLPRFASFVRQREAE